MGLTFSPLIPERSSSIARRRSSVHASQDGGEDNIYLRLANTPKATTAVVVEADSTTPVQKVLQKQDLDKVFRRLSVATTESLAAPKEAPASDTFEFTSPLRSSMSASHAIPSNGEPAAVSVKKSVQLPEKEVEKIFTNLSLKRTASFSQRVVAQQEEFSHAPPAKSPIRTVKLPENNLEKVFHRLSTTNTLSSSSADPDDQDQPAAAAPKAMTRKLSSSNMNGGAGATPVKATSGPAKSAPTSSTATQAAPPVSLRGTGSGKSNTVVAGQSEPTSELPAAPQRKTASAAAPSMPPAPPAVASSSVPAKSKAKPAAAAPAGGGDFLSKLEASLNFLESQQKVNGAPVAAIPPKKGQPPVEAPAAPHQLRSVFETVDADAPDSDAAAEEVAVEEPAEQQSEAALAATVEAAAPRPKSNGSKIPVSPKGNGSSTKPPAAKVPAAASGGKGPIKRLPSQDSASAPSSSSGGGGAPASKVIKGKKKSADEASSAFSSANTSQIIPPAAAAADAQDQQSQQQQQKPVDDASHFLNSIPQISTEGSDSDSAPEEH